MPDPFPHQVTVVWGESRDEETRPNTYSFETEAEVHAFLLGVAEMDGWAGYEVVDDGAVYCTECREVMVADENGECPTCNEETEDA